MNTPQDYYLIDRNCHERLLSEYQKYGSLIVAFDFDNTVFDYSKHDNQCSMVINLLRECRKEGFHLILFTSCNADRIPEIVDYMKSNNIPYDAINETPEYIPFQGRKVYYNILLDDRAGLSAAYNTLSGVIHNIRGLRASSHLDDIG